MSGTAAPDTQRKAKRGSAIAVVVATLVGLAVAVAGSQGGATFSGIPVFLLVAALAFVIQWVAFVPAYLRQTERFFDITGSVTFISVTAVAVLLSPAPDARSFVLLAAVSIWAIRLGSYLVRRIHAAGKDDRFDAIKPDAVRFLSVWTIQALWVTLTVGAALAAISTATRAPLDLVSVIGIAIWMIGIAIEAVADLQKSRFRADPANRGTFIRSGLWAWSRHPNYFGEIVLWAGLALVAFPVLAGWQYVTLISPLFVALLLTRVSGIPMLEAKADAKWGGQADYEAYKSGTPVLVPMPPRKG
jgi:steroid 5-alpha reductase family enzyme